MQIPKSLNVGFNTIDGPEIPQLKHKRPPRHSPEVQKIPLGTLVFAANIPTPTVASTLFDSARNTLINGGQFTAAANLNRNVTINISEGITPQLQTEIYHTRRNTDRSRNRRRGPMRPQQGSTAPTQRSNEIYEQHLRLKKRGHPLWIPQSNMVLPILYRAQGVRVGDVGIFTEDGGFDFLFNICVPRDDPINPAELPENFVPIYPPIHPTDIRHFAQFSPGSYLTSSSVEKSTTAEQSSGLTFESSASEGAILTMPEGAYSEDLSNLSRFRGYIATYAEDWYRFVNGPRGREAQNGGLRVVAGCDKTTSWGMATFANSSLSRNTNFRLKFSALGEQPSQCNAGNKYTWEHSGVAEVKVGPGRGENEELGETDSSRLRNQCLFVRTLNVTLSENVWKEICPQTLAVADENHSHSGMQDQSIYYPQGGSMGHSHAQLSQSDSSQNSLLQSYDSTVVAEETSGSQTLSNSDSTPSSPDIGLTHSSSCNDVLWHPSEIINQYLLEQFPGARVAVTHDRDWSGVIGKNSCHSDPSQLLSVVCSMNEINFDPRTGVTFLELKETDENGLLLTEAKVAEYGKSIKDGTFTLDQYLFGFEGDHSQRLRDLCNALRSGSTSQQIPMLSSLAGHPERLMSLDEICSWCDRDLVDDLQDHLSLLPSQHPDRSNDLLCLANALSRRFLQWAQVDDLEDAIWFYEEAQSLIPNTHYHYLETLLGLCSSLYRRFDLLGHADDLKNLLKYLELQYDVVTRLPSILAPVETQLQTIRKELEDFETPLGELVEDFSEPPFQPGNPQRGKRVTSSDPDVVKPKEQLSSIGIIPVDTLTQQAIEIQLKRLRDLVSEEGTTDPDAMKQIDTLEALIQDPHLVSGPSVKTRLNKDSKPDLDLFTMESD